MFFMEPDRQSWSLEPCRYMPDIVSAELMSYGYDYRRRYLHSLHNNVKNFKKPRDLIHLTGISLEPKLLRTSQLLNGPASSLYGTSAVHANTPLTVLVTALDITSRILMTSLAL